MKKKKKEEDRIVFREDMDGEEILDALGIDKEIFEEMMLKNAVQKRLKEIEEEENKKTN